MISHPARCRTNAPVVHHKLCPHRCCEYTGGDVPTAPQTEPWGHWCKGCAPGILVVPWTLVDGSRGAVTEKRCDLGPIITWHYCLNSRCPQVPLGYPQVRKPARVA